MNNVRAELRLIWSNEKYRSCREAYRRDMRGLLYIVWLWLVPPVLVLGMSADFCDWRYRDVLLMEYLLPYALLSSGVYVLLLIAMFPLSLCWPCKHTYYTCDGWRKGCCGFENCRHKECLIAERKKLYKLTESIHPFKLIDRKLIQPMIGAARACRSSAVRAATWTFGGGPQRILRRLFSVLEAVARKLAQDCLIRRWPLAFLATMCGLAIAIALNGVIGPGVGLAVTLLTALGLTEYLTQPQTPSHE